MALSNIWREPRRESIEQVVGTVVFAAVLVIPVLASLWGVPRFSGAEDPNFGHYLLGTLAAILCFMIAFLLLWMFAAMCHAIGEVVCESLAESGRDPRPMRWDLERRNRVRAYDAETIRRVEGTPEQIKKKWKHLMPPLAGTDYDYWLAPVERTKRQPGRVRL